MIVPRFATAPEEIERMPPIFAELRKFFTPLPEKVRLLNSVEFDPPMFCEELLFIKIVVEVFVNVPPLSVQSPPTLCIKAPPTNVVPEPNVNEPLIVNAATAVTDAEPLNAKDPPIEVVPVCSVLIPDPDNVNEL